MRTQVFRGAEDGEVAVGESLTFDIPEPPSINQMLRASRASPFVYSRAVKLYRQKLANALVLGRVRTPRAPWNAWALTAMHFRLHGLRDEQELAASLKWAIDALVKIGFARDDDPNSFRVECRPTQTIDRKRRGVTLTFRRDA